MNSLIIQRMHQSKPSKPSKQKEAHFPHFATHLKDQDTHPPIHTVFPITYTGRVYTTKGGGVAHTCVNGASSRRRAGHFPRRMGVLLGQRGQDRRPQGPSGVQGCWALASAGPTEARPARWMGAALA